MASNTKKLEVGMKASRTRTITAEDIDLFAKVSGDHNPIHVDETFAATSRFGKRVAHGMLTASLISAVLGEDLPGTGSIYLSQQVTFKAPVFIGDTITITVEVIKYRAERKIATLRTSCTNQHDVLVVDGEAVVLLSE